MGADFKKTGYGLTEWCKNGKRYVSTMINADSHAGILRFSHELALTLSVNRDGTLKFEDAWEIGSGGDWTYDSARDFEEDHPGLIKDIEKSMSEIKTGGYQ